MACLIEMLLGIHRATFPVHKITRFEITSYRQQQPVRWMGGEMLDYINMVRRYEAVVSLDGLKPIDHLYLGAITKNNDEITIGPIQIKDGSSIRVIGSIKTMSADMAGTCTLHLDVRHAITDRGIV